MREKRQIASPLLFTELKQHNAACLISVLFECCNVEVGNLCWLWLIPLEEMPLAVVNPETITCGTYMGLSY